MIAPPSLRASSRLLGCSTTVKNSELNGFASSSRICTSIARKIFRISNVDSRRFRDHSFDEYRRFDDFLVSHVSIDDEHDLLRPSTAGMGMSTLPPCLTVSLIRRVKLLSTSSLDGIMSCLSP